MYFFLQILLWMSYFFDHFCVMLHIISLFFVFLSVYQFHCLPYFQLFRSYFSCSIYIYIKKTVKCIWRRKLYKWFIRTNEAKYLFSHAQALLTPSELAEKEIRYLKAYLKICMFMLREAAKVIFLVAWPLREGGRARL